VLYGTYATLIIPIAAQAIFFVDTIWSSNVSIIRGVPRSTPDTWRIFAVELYIAGLLLFAARLLTQLFCPPRVQRFPHEDEHLVFIGQTKSAKKAIADLAGEADSVEDSGDVGAHLSRATKVLLEGVAATINSWRQDNESWPVLRLFVALLYTLGCIGVVAYLAWRGIGNATAVLQLRQ
jgi:hypothetical protein